jgi:hypothetical protein
MHRLRVQSMQVQEPEGRPVDPHDDSIPRKEVSGQVRSDWTAY